MHGTILPYTVWLQLWPPYNFSSSNACEGSGLSNSQPRNTESFCCFGFSQPGFLNVVNNSCLPCRHLWSTCITQISYVLAELAFCLSNCRTVMAHWCWLCSHLTCSLWGPSHVSHVINYIISNNYVSAGIKSCVSCWCHVILFASCDPEHKSHDAALVVYNVDLWPPGILSSPLQSHTS